MSKNSKKPSIGDLQIDCSDLTYLVDLEPGATRGMRQEKEGVDEVIQEIESRQPEYGKLIGVSDESISNLVIKRQRVQDLDSRIPAVAKLLELLEETRLKEAYDCERIISNVADHVDLAVKTLGDNSLNAKYEGTRAYRSKTAMKGAKTRQRNQKTPQNESSNQESK